jgi:hypothetical protein
MKRALLYVAGALLELCIYLGLILALVLHHS